MGYSNPFRGVNSYCLDCRKSCKQYEIVKIIMCPNRQKVKMTLSNRVKSGKSAI